MPLGVCMRYLDPKNDLTFKKVFGNHPNLLISFLNALLPLEPGREVVEIEYLPTELVPEIPEVRNSIVDVRCRDREGRHFIVEMQMLWTDSFFRRVLFNASKAYVRQIRPGQKFKCLQPVYSLNLINAVFRPNAPDWYHHYRIVNMADTGERIDGLEFVFVELPKFTPQSFPQRKLMLLWLRFLTEVGEETKEVDGELYQQEEVREAIDLVRESAFTEEELVAYEDYWDSVRVERSMISDALETGEAKGRQTGHAEGELQARKEIAKLMSAQGFSPEQIKKITGVWE